MIVCTFQVSFLGLEKAKTLILFQDLGIFTAGPIAVLPLSAEKLHTTHCTILYTHNRTTVAPSIQGSNKHVTCPAKASRLLTEGMNPNIGLQF